MEELYYTELTRIQNNRDKDKDFVYEALDDLFAKNLDPYNVGERFKISRPKYVQWHHDECIDFKKCYVHLMEKKIKFNLIATPTKDRDFNIHFNYSATPLVVLHRHKGFDESNWRPFESNFHLNYFEPFFEEIKKLILGSER